MTVLITATWYVSVEIPAEQRLWRLDSPLRQRDGKVVLRNQLIWKTVNCLSRDQAREKIGLITQRQLRRYVSPDNENFTNSLQISVTAIPGRVHADRRCNIRHRSIDVNPYPFHCHWAFVC